MTRISSIEAVGAAVRKLALAASEHLGGDCLLHAELGRALLAELGMNFRTIVGLAAWRLGQGDGDVLSHVFDVPSFLPPGVMGLPYHAWLQSEDMLLDLTTYQLRTKAQQLDAMDGGTTQVDWCPELLFVPLSTVHTYREVANSVSSGVYFYSGHQDLQTKVMRGFQLDEQDLLNARIILANPSTIVKGPFSSEPFQLHR